MDFILAHSRCKRRRYDEAIAICDQLLQKNAQDEAAWMLKCQCLIKENYVDQLETEETALADQLVENNQINHLARPGTSFKASNQLPNPIMRPLNSGRLNTGFQRVGTAASRAGDKNRMLRTGRVMTKGGVPTTSNGRVLRLATASLQQYGSSFFDVSKVDLQRVAQRQSKARLIFLYLFHVQHNLKKALQLAVFATELHKYDDPWWKLALGKCYYHLGFNLEAEKQLLSSLRHNNNIESSLYLSRIYQKEDNVAKSIKALELALTTHPYEPKLHLALGRIYDSLGNLEESHKQYLLAMNLQNCNVQAVANFAAYYFYKDQAEVSLKFYQRLLELGYESAEVWNNMGLCCFVHSQYHVFYSCFQRAITAAKDDPLIASDVWYNIGCIYISLGELEMATQALKISLSYLPENSQALNNLAVISSRQGNYDAAINYAQKSYRESSNVEAAYNLSIWYFKLHQLQKAHQYNQLALQLYPQHAESIELATRLLLKLDRL